MFFQTLEGQISLDSLHTTETGCTTSYADVE